MRKKIEDILFQEFGRIICSAAETAFLAGELIRKEKVGQAVQKADVNVGHHAIVLDADVKSQSLIISRMGSEFPGVLFLVEEDDKNNNPRIITEKTLGLIDQSDIICADPLDGTTERALGSFGWSISIGIAEQGNLGGGAIYAPLVLGGLLVVAQVGKGICAWEGGVEKKQIKVSDKPMIRKGAILIGQDLIFLKQFQKFNYELARTAQMVNTASSCALGLAQVALGQKTAIIQPHQGPWDYIAGIPMVLEAGGAVVFYHYRSGNLEFSSHPDLPSFNPKIRNLGFIAGSHRAVEEIIELLQKTFVEKV